MPAPAELPTEEKVRELTADPKLTPDDANRYGDLFCDAGKHAVALMFYERTRDRDRLGRLKKAAMEAGDAFLLHGVNRLAPDFVEPAEWKEAGERALREGKFLFARDCFDKAGEIEKAHAAREAWLKIFVPGGTPG